MKIYKTKGGRIFDILNHIFLITFAFLCILPMIHILAISFSHTSAVMANRVTFWPVEFTKTSYKYVMHKKAFLSSFIMSLKRVGLGTLINMALIVFAAYPLSKESSAFKGRTCYAWIIFITMIFSGGLIPTYMVVNETKIMDSIWALILPNAVPVFNVVLMLNFFRQIPKDLEEAAFIDGAGHWRILFQIYLPVSLPAIATILLYVVVTHWNSWFDGLIFMSRPENYPLQSYLRTIIIARDLEYLTQEEWQAMQELSDRTIKSAQIFLAAIPILCVYPFLQKYFIKGIVVGSVKG